MASEKQVLVAVTNTVEIPYEIHLRGKSYQFDPQTLVPEDLAKMLVENQPKLFFLVKDDQVIDASKYAVKDVFQGKTVEEIFKMLPSDERLQIYALAKKLATEVRRREQREKEKELAAISDRGPDALQIALGIDSFPKDVIDGAVSTETKPDIKNVGTKGKK